MIEIIKLFGPQFWILIFVVFFIIAVNLRKVVSTNEVHIINRVQGSKKTFLYGISFPDGNSYLAWPYWIPIFGVTVIKLPLSVFNIKIDGLKIHDKNNKSCIFNLFLNAMVMDPLKLSVLVPNYEQLEKLIIKGSIDLANSTITNSEISNFIDISGRKDFIETTIVSDLKKIGVIATFINCGIKQVG